MPIDTTVPADVLRCIMDAKLIIQGERRENNVVRQAAQTIDCSVFGGELEVDSEGQILPSHARRWNVLIIRSDWLDHKIPQTGDIHRIVGYPDMTVVHVMEENSVIDMSCRSTGEVPRG